MAARAVRRELALASVVQDGFGHNRSRGVAGAEEENVVMIRHDSYPFAPARAGAASRLAASVFGSVSPDEGAEDLVIHPGSYRVHVNARDQAKPDRPLRNNTSLIGSVEVGGDWTATPKTGIATCLYAVGFR